MFFWGGYPVMGQTQMYRSSVAKGRISGWIYPTSFSLLKHFSISICVPKTPMNPIYIPYIYIHIHIHIHIYMNSAMKSASLKFQVSRKFAMRDQRFPPFT